MAEKVNLDAKELFNKTSKNRYSGFIYNLWENTSIFKAKKMSEHNGKLL